MRLDAKREREVARRKGLTVRTILAMLWMALCILAAYYLANYLFENEILKMSFFRGPLRIPYSISDTVIVIGFMLVIVIAINFLFLVVYGLFSSAGRRRPGTPSMYSADPDPDDHKFDYR